MGFQAETGEDVEPGHVAESREERQVGKNSKAVLDTL